MRHVLHDLPSDKWPDGTTHAFLSQGNSKLPKTCAIFNLLAVEDCPNCETCKDTCYALFRQGEPRVYKHRAINSYYARNNTASLRRYIAKELTSFIKKGVKYVRIHESGDFISEDYYNMWRSIAEEFPSITFFAMTKNTTILQLHKPLPNFNLMSSFVNGLRNYGSKEYCEKLKEEHNAYICPDTGHNGVCLVKCKYCMKGQNPCFMIHGNLKARDKYENTTKNR